MDLYYGHFEWHADNKDKMRLSIDMSSDSQSDPGTAWSLNRPGPKPLGKKSRARTDLINAILLDPADH